MNKLFLFVAFLVLELNINAQKIDFPEWSKFSEYEKELKIYEKDTTAHAVVLSEVGYTYIDDGGEYKLFKEHYVRIKILDKEGFKQATIELPTYKESKIINIKANTTNFSNGIKTVFLKKENIYRTKTSENWSLTSFTLPAIEVGSIIQYSYTEKKPYRFNFGDGWVFQDNIPKISSVYHAKIPGFWQYHITTISLPEIMPQEHRVINNCLSSGNVVASCLYIKYKVENIPAFIEEDHMTTKFNFLKQIRFELKSFTDDNGIESLYSKSWKDVDKELFTDYNIGKKYGKTRFIKDKIPIEIYNEKNSLEKAKKVYLFIKNHFNWNGKYQLFKDFSLKKSFELRIGNITEINTSLINALKATGINANIVLLSTRDNGVPRKLHPVISDFNYLVAHININGKDYLLDATNKKIPFGVLQYDCLNGEVRVFNKKRGSYWLDYPPVDSSGTTIYTIANLSENTEINVKSRIVYSGYTAISKRKEIARQSLVEYKDNFEEDQEALTVLKHEIKNINKIEKPLIEMLEYQVNSDIVNRNTVYFNPFLIKSITKNPFTLSERHYPIDMGFKKNIKYNIAFNIPDNYSIKSLPENRKIILPNGGGTFTYLLSSKNNKITINLIFALNKTKYPSKEYQYLKDFFSELITAQNEMIILTKN